jgi:SecD/SecF fusion protein
MPLSPDAKNSAETRRELRERMISAEDALKATNVAPDAVIDAIENKNGKTQADLVKLAGDDKIRIALFNNLKDLWNQIQQAHKSQDAETEARLRVEYDRKIHPKTEAGADARSPIEETNLTRDQLDEILASTETQEDQTPEAKKEAVDQRAQELDALRKKFAEFPSRLAAIQKYVDAATDMANSKGAIDDATDLKRLLKGAGVLEYHILATDMPSQEYQQYVERLQTDGARIKAGDQARWFEVGPQENFPYPTQTYNKKRYVLGYITPGPDGKPRSLDAHADKPWHLTDARIESQMTGEKVVGFSFDPQGAQYFGDLTGANIGKPMAIVLDNKVISAPNINGKIGASGIIEGGHNGFEPAELDYLVSTLKAGSLPATLSDEPISERTVGPQLGQDNLNSGLIACALGLVVVAVFLIGYYFLAGLVATCAVMMNVLLVLAVMSAINATFTLPSIAGIVLSVGTAVDANVLIFERLREEQHRGLSLRLALRNAYGKAFSAILDSNMTTVITSLFLIWFGTEEVKGFGVTLIIGIVASLFTALFVTRTVFNVLMDHFGVTTLSSVPLKFPKWDKALRPNIDWMGKAWAFISFSVVGITIGLVLFIVKVRQGEMIGIEFAKGTSVQFELAKAMPQAKLREIVEKRADPNALPSPSVVTVGSDERTYEIVTPNADAVRVRDAVLKALVDDNGQTLLKVDVPSKFEGTGAPLAGEINKLVIPLEDKKTPGKAQWPGGFVPENVKDYEPGVAVVLSNLDPPLTTGQILDRIRQQQLQLPPGNPAGALDITVASRENKTDVPTSLAVVLCRNDALPFSKDPTKWQDSLAGPLWQLVNDSVNRPAQLQQVKNFDSQVAQDARTDAAMTLVFSILVIMVYIWFRFGNLKYGTATMVALIHDVLFTIAALGFAHYLWQIPGIGRLLQLEPFRIDLTVVAGILTIMGYSMIDTIVVFDRIRENRGKFGTVSRHVINDAINQTLSRTLLTAGINVMTVAIMYFIGGPGIHGFTFVLLIGILVGTYSSVAIAAPILLVGQHEEQKATRSRGQLRPAGA